MTAVHSLNPDSADPPAGRYSHLSITSAHARIANFAGQIATTGPGMPDNARDQTRLVFAAIKTLLSSQGAVPSDLIRMITLIVGRDNLIEFNAVRDEIYAD
jgi:2-iminobutanoate/2-iminopropanoate deaminase